MDQGQPLLTLFYRCKSGNFGLLFAVLMVPLTIVVGAALDYSYATVVRQRLQDAADAAAVGALSDQSVGIITSLNSNRLGAITLSQSDAAALMMANTTAAIGSYMRSYDISVRRETDAFTSSVVVHARVPTSILGVVGLLSVDVSVAAKARYVPSEKIDFFVVLDNSPSMGLGATTEDIQKLEAANSECAFACHVSGRTYDSFRLAKDLGIITRIQMVNLAAQMMLETAEKTRRYVEQYRVAVYSLGDRAETRKLTKIAPLSTDLARVSQAMSVIDLMSIPYPDYDNDQMTDFKAIFASLAAELQYSRSKALGRERVIFFVTDGVNDSYSPGDCSKRTIAGRCQSPINPYICDALKASGVRIAVLYTTYYPLDRSAWYKSWIKPFYPEIAKNLGSCASPGLFFEVGPDRGIEEAMTALFLKVVRIPTLTM